MERAFRIERIVRVKTGKHETAHWPHTPLLQGSAKLLPPSRFSPISSGHRDHPRVSHLILTEQDREPWRPAPAPPLSHPAPRPVPGTELTGRPG